MEFRGNVFPEGEFLFHNPIALLSCLWNFTSHTRTIKLLEESFTLPPDIPASGRSEWRTGYYSLFITAKRYHVREEEGLSE